MIRFGERLGDRAGRSAVFALAVVAAWAAEPRGSLGYRFLDELDVPYEYRIGQRFRPPSNFWHPDSWGPGEVLSWTLVDSPGWEPDVETVRATAEEALERWSSIATADIRWKLGKVADAQSISWPQETALIFGKEPGSPGPAPGYAQIFSDATQDDSRLRILRCEVVLYLGHPVSLSIMVHEMGHCLGLDHPDSYKSRSWPVSRPERPRPYEPPAAWREEPTMLQASPSGLALDDRIGASLLRPQTGWIEGTGTIWGNVLIEGGEPAARVNVLATRLGANGALVESVARITDSRGEFVIQGLPPGDYALYVRPLANYSSISRLWRNAAAQSRHLRPAFRAAPVRVAASETTGPITMTMRPNENAVAAR